MSSQSPALLSGELAYVFVSELAARIRRRDLTLRPERYTVKIPYKSPQDLAGF